MNILNHHESPLPITEDLLLSPPDQPFVPDTPRIVRGALKAVNSAVEVITSVGGCALLDLAERYFGTSQYDGDKARVQRVSEIIVVIIEHLKRALEENGLGASAINGAPHIYDGSYWVRIEENQCQGMLSWLAEFLGHSAAHSRFYLFREQLLKQLLSALWLNIPDADDDTALVNLRNGTLEITLDQTNLRKFSRDDLLTYQLPFDFDDCAVCPIFDRFLLRVLPDESSRLVLAEFFGWVFLRGLKLEKILVLFGDGFNGKSVLYDIINALFGSENVSHMGFGSLNKIENRFWLGEALLNFSSEISGNCDPDLFKKLASGEPVEARRLFKDVFFMRRYARMACNTNVLPTNTEQTKGFFRRFLIIPFTVTIPEDEADPDLARKIIDSELPGVFNWVMSGLNRLRANRRFSECEASDTALASYRKESDSVALFLDDECWVHSPNSKIAKSEIYKEYRIYCITSGHKALSKSNFGKRLLRQHNVGECKTDGIRFWNLRRNACEES